jgi:hypothetical protein
MLRIMMPNCRAFRLKADKKSKKRKLRLSLQERIIIKMRLESKIRKILLKKIKKCLKKKE